MNRPKDVTLTYDCNIMASKVRVQQHMLLRPQSGNVAPATSDTNSWIRENHQHSYVWRFHNSSTWAFIVEEFLSE